MFKYKSQNLKWASIISAMTTIHTMEDLIRLLDEKPEWADALRSRLLNRDLIELPGRFAAFAADTIARFDGIDARLDRMDVRLDGIDARLDRIDVRLDGIDARFDGMDVRLDRIDVQLDRIEVTLGPLRGAHARNAGIRKVNSIARRLGLRRVRNLSEDDLQNLVDNGDTSELAANELDSFLEADLVIEAKDAQGETAFIAVEISYTVDGRDTARAIRNARLLRWFTGKEASALVTGSPHGRQGAAHHRCWRGGLV